MDKKESRRFFPLLLGTRRTNRETEKVAHYLLRLIGEMGHIESEIIDVATLHLEGGEGTELIAKNPQYRETIVRSAGLIVVAPEYNHGFPGSLKMTLDMLFDEYAGKHVSIVGTSSGAFGGVRMTEALLPVLYDLGFVLHKNTLQVPFVQNLFDGQGKVTDNTFEERARKFLDAV